MEDRYFYFLAWTFSWIVILNFPPGSTAIITAYRLNFLHGLISTLMAFACLFDLVPESMTTTCTLSYFITDFVNIMLNDFVWKAKSYQSPQNRKVEYFHHLFCLTLGLLSEYKYNIYCDFEKNPFVNLMFAEFSTPFLMAWRHFGGDILGFLFVTSFFACRIVYHGGMLIPECMRRCHWAIGYGFGIFYNLLNFYFFYMIISKVIRDFSKKGKKSKGGDKNKDESSKDE